MSKFFLTLAAGCCISILTELERRSLPFDSTVLRKTPLLSGRSKTKVFPCIISYKSKRRLDHEQER
ncbi:MAG: hypothetical protein ACD_87C00032G0004 [uncultured bacterium]|nr:MAG: hypothetical protein ACD_87C00032G0004 [uncultured bacterium]